jgi:alkyldihydroxyacetonephosphate synthase
VNHPGDGARVSHGLDVCKLALGSEGMLGVITRALVKVHKVPEVQRYGSLVFPEWSAGLAFMEELSTLQMAPASVRLVDNLQFQFGRALKPANKSPLLRELQKFFVTRIHGVDLEKMVACTLVYEGNDEEQRDLEARVMRTAKKFGGFGAGGAAGKDGYNLTFGIAYIRDFLLQYWTLGDSFETAVPWGKVDAVISAVKVAVAQSHKASGLEGHPFVTARVSQIYQTGCCVYFYIGFHYKSCRDPLDAFRKLEHDARVAILDAGGALSHHHGIGKIRAEYLNRVKSPAALEWSRCAQAALDPDGIFANGNQNILR